jgi:hypothetical protein
MPSAQSSGGPARFSCRAWLVRLHQSGVDGLSQVVAFFVAARVLIFVYEKEIRFLKFVRKKTLIYVF